MSAATRLRKPNVRLVGLRNLVLDESIQSRVGLDKEWAHQLSEFRKDGAEFPPIGVIQTADGRFLVWSGFHRVEAARLAGDQQVRCEVERGTERDARIKSAGSNRSNGIKPMGTKDLKKAARMLFEDAEWLAKSAVLLAEHIGATPKTLRLWRDKFLAETGRQRPMEIETANGRRIGAGVQVPGFRPTLKARERKGRKYFTARVAKKTFQLGSEEREANRRLDAILQDRRKTTAPPRRKEWVSAQRVSEALNRRLVSAKTGMNGPTSGMGEIVVAGDAALIAAMIDTHRELQAACFLALANRAKHCPGGRAIVVCYDPPRCEALDIAREKLGIEFLTPEELVESLKGEPE